MKTRVISAVILSTLVALMLFFGNTVTAIGVVVFAAISLTEYCNALKKRDIAPMYFICAMSLLLIVFAWLFDRPFSLQIFGREAIGLYIVGTLLIAMIIMILFRKKYGILSLATCFFGGIFISGTMAYTVVLRNMGQGFEGFWYVVTPAFATAMADTFAMLAGKFFGKKKLIPDISPKKTVAGSIGAVVGAIVTTEILGLVLILTGALTALSWYDYIVLGLLAGVFSQFGDLTASSIKRFCGIKDFGNLIPGHGGILDRIDSQMFVIPVSYYYILLVTEILH